MALSLSHSSLVGVVGKRLASVDELQRQVAALESERNAAHATINWRFTTPNARAKLARLYPKLEVADPNTLQDLTDLTTTAIVGLIDPFFHNVEHSTGLAR
jgi:hypothetical protein